MKRSEDGRETERGERRSGDKWLGEGLLLGGAFLLLEAASSLSCLAHLRSALIMLLGPTTYLARASLQLVDQHVGAGS